MLCRGTHSPKVADGWVVPSHLVQNSRERIQGSQKIMGELKRSSGNRELWRVGVVDTLYPKKSWKKMCTLFHMYRKPPPPAVCKSFYRPYISIKLNDSSFSVIVQIMCCIYYVYLYRKACAELPDLLSGWSLCACISDRVDDRHAHARTNEKLAMRRIFRIGHQYKKRNEKFTAQAFWTLASAAFVKGQACSGPSLFLDCSASVVNYLATLVCNISSNL